MDLLTATNVCVTYQGSLAVRDVDIRIAAGELVSLVGSNGAGKSSLLAALCGLHPPTTGVVRFDGTDITQLPAYQIARRGIALVPEGRRLFSHQSVRANLALGCYRHRDRDQQRQSESHVLNMFPVLRDRLDVKAGVLSGGEQQMLALGRALMSRPRLLVLDEPSLGIAPRVVSTIFESIQRIRDHDGVTVLLVEQNVRAALRMSDRIYVLENGSVALHGTPDDLEHTDLVRRAYLGI
jgi:branched-chain amino acid transport system ATP-binding protein